MLARTTAKTRGFWLSVALVSALSACAEETHPPVPDAPGSFLLDNPWQYEGTTLVTSGDESVPFPTDRGLLAAVHYPDGSAPPLGNALDGTSLRFGAGGRLLVAPPSSTDYADIGARYSVTNATDLRVKLAEDVWFSWGYHYDPPSGTLLLDPETPASGAVVGFVCDMLTQSLVTGALDGDAAAIADALSGDPRVETAVASELTALAALDPAVAAEELLELLAASHLLDPNLTGDVIAERLGTVVHALDGVEANALADALVSALLDANVLDPAISSERAEKAIRFALYRQVVTTQQNLAAVERLELELARTDGP